MRSPSKSLKRMLQVSFRFFFVFSFVFKFVIYGLGGQPVTEKCTSACSTLSQLFPFYMTKAVHMNKNNWVGVYDSYYRTLFLEAVPVIINTSMPFLLHVRFQNSFKERQICKKGQKCKRKPENACSISKFM